MLMLIIYMETRIYLHLIFVEKQLMLSLFYTQIRMNFALKI